MLESSARLRAVFCRRSTEPEIVAELQAFRKRLFVDRLGWSLNTHGEREIDQFDTDSAEHCALYRNGELVAGFRAIRTDDNYLAINAFPELAATCPYPRRRDTWEISRFGVLADENARTVAKLNYGMMFRFAGERHARALVAVADLVYERYLAALGITTRRYGPPQIVGKTRSGEDLVCVAGEIPLGAINEQRIGELVALTRQVEVTDGTLVLGPAAIPA